MPRCLPMLTSFFDRFLMGFCSQLRPPEPHGSSPRCSESTIYQKFAFHILHRFFIDFGANMPPFSFQKSTKIDSKSSLEGIIFLIDFCIDFLSLWARFGNPIWNQKGAAGKGDWSLNSPRGRPDTSEDALDPSQNTKMDPKWKPPTPKMLPKWNPKPTKMNPPTSPLEWIFGIDF